MNEIELEKLRYPIGRFEIKDEISIEVRKKYIIEIEETPFKLKKAVHELTNEQLNTQYRPGGWTVKQVIHHLPDSHMNSYIRFKLALTENEPTIKTYNESAWAMLNDSIITDISVSINLLESLHKRWVDLLYSMSPSDFSRYFRHLELGLINLDRVTALYAWHGNHHIAQITSLKERMNW